MKTIYAIVAGSIFCLVMFGSAWAYQLGPGHARMDDGVLDIVGLQMSDDFLLPGDADGCHGADAGWMTAPAGRMNFDSLDDVVGPTARHRERSALGEVAQNGNGPVVPIPAAGWLLGAGVIALFALRRQAQR